MAGLLPAFAISVNEAEIMELLNGAHDASADR
jgi:hypothetical protein